MKRAAALLCALLIVPQLAAAAKWFDWYNKGVAAVRGNQYKDGADALQHAIAEMPNESTSARAGNVIITYVPRALRELKTSEEQGAVQNTQYFGSLREWVARANSQKQRNAETGAAESRKTANAAMSRALDGQAEALSAGADRSDSYRAALRKLQEALETFNKAGTDVGAYRHASDLAGQARELFTASADAAKKEKASRPPAVTAKPAPPKPHEFVVPFPVDETPPPKTQTSPVTTTVPKPELPNVQPAKPDRERDTRLGPPRGTGLQASSARCPAFHAGGADSGAATRRPSQRRRDRPREGRGRAGRESAGGEECKAGHAAASRACSGP